MKWRKHFSLAAILYVYAAPAAALTPLAGGSPKFGMALIISSEPVQSEVYRLIVDCWSAQHAPDVTADVHVFIPDGVQVLSGDIERKLHPSMGWSGQQDARWEILFKVRSPGKIKMQGTMSIRESAGVADETDCAVESIISSEGRPSRARSRETRFERVENGDRFRYGGAYMVAIDGPESITSADVVTRATILTSPAGTCSKCGPTGRRSVHLVITVGRNGRVRWIRPDAGLVEGDKGKLSLAARDAIRAWTFAPAQTKDGVPVNSAMELDVPVEVVH